jgi:hypothetical protein
MLPLNTRVRVSGRRNALSNAPEQPWHGCIIHAYPDINEYLIQPDTDPIPRQVRHEHVKQQS